MHIYKKAFADAKLRHYRYKESSAKAYCPNLLVHHSVFERVGLFSEVFSYGSDAEFAMRLEKEHIRVKYSSKLILEHQGADSTLGIFGKWFEYGKGRYKRYRPFGGFAVAKSLITPNLFRFKEGAFYNCCVALCLLFRWAGMVAAVFARD